MARKLKTAAGGPPPPALQEARAALYRVLHRACCGCGGRNFPLAYRGGDPPRYVGGRQAQREEEAPCSRCGAPARATEVLRLLEQYPSLEDLPASATVAEELRSLRPEEN